jgi:hypothetical protein
VRDNVVQLALDEPALSPRELAVHFTDSQSYFVSEASVYRQPSWQNEKGSKRQTIADHRLRHRLQAA